MKSKMKKGAAFFLPFYIAFSIVCGMLYLLFGEWKITLLRLWYLVTILFWVALAVTVIRLLIKRWKLNKQKNEMKRWED